MMQTTRPLRILVSAVLLGATATLAAANAEPAGAHVLHFGLAKSVPADKSTVHALSEVRLWFTEAPQEGTVSIRITGPGGALVPAADPVRDAEDDQAFSVRLNAPGAAGAYTVSWRGMGRDGHVVRGEIAFNVMAH
jgi:methionine-rich copper-binding protein CopC